MNVLCGDQRPRICIRRKRETLLGGTLTRGRRFAAERIRARANNRGEVVAAAEGS